MRRNAMDFPERGDIVQVTHPFGDDKGTNPRNEAREVVFSSSDWVQYRPWPENPHARTICDIVEPVGSWRQWALYGRGVMLDA